jgi:hypothetical protein
MVRFRARARYRKKKRKGERQKSGEEETEAITKTGDNVIIRNNTQERQNELK